MENLYRPFLDIIRFDAPELIFVVVVIQFGSFVFSCYSAVIHKFMLLLVLVFALIEAIIFLLVVIQKNNIVSPWMTSQR